MEERRENLRNLQQDQNFNGELLQSGRLLWKYRMEGWVCVDYLAQCSVKQLLYSLRALQKWCHFMHHSQLSLLTPASKLLYQQNETTLASLSLESLGVNGIVFIFAEL